MQGSCDHGIRTVRTVHDLLNRITDPTAPIAADSTLLQLIGISFMRVTLSHGYRCITVAAGFGLRQGSAASAQQSITVVGWQVVLDAKSLVAWIAVCFNQSSCALLTNIVVLAALPAESNLKRLPTRTVFSSASAIQHNRVDSVLVNEECAFKGAQKRMVASRGSAVGVPKRFTEDDGRIWERLSEELGSEFGNRPTILFALA